MQQAREIAARLKARRSGRQWVTHCVCHEDRNPSMLIFEGREQVQFRCLAGCSSIDIVRELSARGILEGGRRAGDGNGTRYPRPDVARETLRAARNIELAMAIWNEAVDPRATLAELYLVQRGLALPRELCGRLLRYHPACPVNSSRSAALLVAMSRLESDKPCGIQRIFLNKAGKKTGKPMMLGPAGPMKLTDHWSTFSECLSYASRLHVAEGFETALALYGVGRRPMWAMGSAGAIRSMPVIFGVGELVIWADHDEAGLTAARECAQRWRAAAGKAARIIKPKREGADFADCGVINGA